MFICKAVDGTCKKLTSLDSLGNGGGGVTPPGPTPGGGPVTIKFPVGINGRNEALDVLNIQVALIQVGPANGGQTPDFAIDGICGPKTKAAIQKFQLQHFGWKGCDGLIEPGKQTLAKLNELLGHGGGGGIPILGTGPGGAAKQALLPATPAAPPTELQKGIALALKWILAAQTNVISAIPYVNSKDTPGPFQVFGREFRMRQLNNHFLIDKTPAKMANTRFVLKTFDRMRQVFERPGGLWGEAAFEKDPLNDNTVFAYTWWGGFFKGGQHRVEKQHKIRLDSIFLSPPFNPLIEERKAFTIIHELAHFVGHPEFIDDHAYNFQGQMKKINNLPPHLKLLNAESYSNFAYEVANGKPAPIF
ncbi:MAG: peptidoglycan-binding protein [Bryobacterales bacterium]|nr:peptidoglycan-binding protein [Bryobacterales bacterium]